MSRGGLPAEWTMNEPPTKAQAGPSEGKGQPPPRVDLSMADLAVILEHAKTALSDTEFATLQEAMQTLAFLTRELEKKSVSIQRLKQLLFGASTETTAKVIQAVRQAVGTGSASAGPAGAKPKGHGRNGAEAYVGAQLVQVALEQPARRRRLPDLQEGHRLHQRRAGADRAADGAGPDRRDGVRTGEVALQPVRAGVHRRGPGGRGVWQV